MREASSEAAARRLLDRDFTAWHVENPMQGNKLSQAGSFELWIEGVVAGYCVPMSRSVSPSVRIQHAPQNAMEDPDEVERFHDCCSDLMRELLDALAAAPDQPRSFPEIEDSLAWPRRRIASVLGGVWHLRTAEFGGRRPYRCLDGRQSRSGRWELWMDSIQARAVHGAQRQ